MECQPGQRKVVFVKRLDLHNSSHNPQPHSIIYCYISLSFYLAMLDSSPLTRNNFERANTAETNKDGHRNGNCN